MKIIHELMKMFNAFQYFVFPKSNSNPIVSFTSQIATLLSLCFTVKYGIGDFFSNPMDKSKRIFEFFKYSFRFFHRVAKKVPEAIFYCKTQQK